MTAIHIANLEIWVKTRDKQTNECIWRLTERLNRWFSLFFKSVTHCILRIQEIKDSPYKQNTQIPQEGFRTISVRNVLQIACF